MNIFDRSEIQDGFFMLFDVLFKDSIIRRIIILYIRDYSLFKEFFNKIDCVFNYLILI